MAKKQGKKRTTAGAKSSKTFANRFEELEKIVESFDSEELDVDASVKQFEKGLKLAEELKETLESVENKIETLKKKYHVEEE